MAKQIINIKTSLIPWEILDNHVMWHLLLPFFLFRLHPVVLLCLLDPLPLGKGLQCRMEQGVKGTVKCKREMCCWMLWKGPHAQFHHFSLFSCSTFKRCVSFFPQLLYGDEGEGGEEVRAWKRSGEWERKGQETGFLQGWEVRENSITLSIFRVYIPANIHVLSVSLKP